VNDGAQNTGSTNATAPRQLVLDLRHRPALGAEDYLVTPATEAAITMVDRWPNWTHWAAMIVGPRHSGKTHLANVWRLKSGAQTVDAAKLEERHVEHLKSFGALAIENLERGIADEKLLFHLLNVARENKKTILLTSEKVPADLVIKLPDLRSRLRALPVVTLGAPDDQLLTMVLIKLFADRQLTVDPTVVSYLATHMDRSLAHASDVVAELDRRALAEKRRVTRSLASAVLSRPGRNALDAIDARDSDND
jgi:chromosomal replication initiation ATPase DnaA